MKHIILVLGVIVVVSARVNNVLPFDDDVEEDVDDEEDIEIDEEDVGTDADENVLPLAEPCNPQACQLPDCRCSSTDIPGRLRARDTPQFVMLTFDGALTIANIDSYREILYERRNRNQCPVGATFFVNHHYSNYQIVNELYNQGFEIALNSITAQTPQSYWAEASYDVIKEEIADQILQIAYFANIPEDVIKGVRMPFFQLAGNNSFHVMSDFNLKYDSSWPTQEIRNPGLWPYTLDYASTQDCQIPPCPTASIPGVWVAPGISWIDLEEFACVTVDSCINVPDRGDEEAWFRFIVGNFERHYLGNRAPFAFFARGGYMSSWPAVKRAYVRFFNLINQFNDVFMVTAEEVIDWVKNPIPVNEYLQKPCKTFTSTDCDNYNVCVLTAEHNNQTYWMSTCTECPNTYPWVGNPLGL